MARKQKADEETVIQLLKDATELHFSALRGLNYGVEYLQMLDLNFLLRIVCMHLESKQVYTSFLILLYFRICQFISNTMGLISREYKN